MLSIFEGLIGITVICSW